MLRAVLVTALWSGVAAASPAGVRAVVDEPGLPRRGSAAEWQRGFVVTPPEAFTAPVVPQVSPFLYLNRCTGGCVVHGGTSNDARTQHTSIPPAGDYNIGEFADATGASGAAADSDWAAVVKCMQEVYSPYAITVTDQVPANTSYTEAIIAGQPGDIGRPIDNLGVAPIAANCAAEDNVISFSFANHHPGTGTTRLLDICWTAAQESAHAFGLDHEYVFTDGSSTCRDPMTYRDDCGGEKFFRNSRAQCGEDAARACRCGGTQNSHAMLLNVFGPGTPITAPPHVTIVGPDAGSTILGGQIVHATAGAQRGVAKVALFLNGSQWASLPGAAFGANGQPDADYALTIPTTVPNSIIDVVVRATDDLGISTDSDPVTVTKGQACTAATDCLQDQSCTDGKCAYPPPPGQLGDACPYAQYCQSWECVDTDVGKRCVSDCEVDEPSSCPANFTCQDLGGGKGACVEVEVAGCCAVARGSGRSNPWPAFGLGAFVLGLVLRRRR